MLATSAPYLAVIDADMQHDEAILPAMLSAIKTENLDIVVGSRNVEGGGMGEFAAHRQALSHWGRRLSAFVCKCEINDPMSGFFLLNRRFFEEVAHRLSGISFKILVDLLASSKRPVRIKELPYQFRNRQFGESKLDTTNLLEYLFLLADKTLGAYVPVGFVLFSLSGLAGAIAFAILLPTLYTHYGISFAISQATALFTAMTVNFFVNNWVTYRDRRLKGWRIITGLLAFYIACSIGAIGSFSIATLGFEKGIPWQLSGFVGLVISSVWNYGVTSVLTWRRSVRK
jgi:dolichol-phosphate mannosyltransferase